MYTKILWIYKDLWCLIVSSEAFHCLLLPLCRPFLSCRAILLLFPHACVFQVVLPDFRSPAVPVKTSFKVSEEVILEYGFGLVLQDKVWAPVCSIVWLPHQRMSMKALLWVKNVAVWHAEGWWMGWHPREQMRGQTVEAPTGPPGPLKVFSLVQAFCPPGGASAGKPGWAELWLTSSSSCLSEGRQAYVNIWGLFADENRCKYQCPNPHHPHEPSFLSVLINRWF